MEQPAVGIDGGHAQRNVALVAKIVARGRGRRRVPIAEDDGAFDITVDALMNPVRGNVARDNRNLDRRNRAQPRFCLHRLDGDR